MSSQWRNRVFKVLIAAAWAVLFIEAYAWFESSGIQMRHMPRLLKATIHSYGAWGPLFVLFLYTVRTFLFLPTTPLILVCGSLFGPIWGTVVALAGENLSAGLGFAIGRLFGRRFLKIHERGWMKRYDEALTTEGFVSVLVMRLLMFPFDVVNIGSGVSGMRFRQYALATLIGVIPLVVTVAALGDAFVNPRAFRVFIVLILVMAAVAVLIRRSSWAKRKLYVKNGE